MSQAPERRSGMIVKIIVLYLILKMCFPGSSISRCVVRIVCWGLKLFAVLFLLWLLLHTIN